MRFRVLANFDAMILYELSFAGGEIYGQWLRIAEQKVGGENRCVLTVFFVLRSGPLREHGIPRPLSESDEAGRLVWIPFPVGPFGKSDLNLTHTKRLSGDGLDFDDCVS